MKRILLDVDGVLCDFIGGVCQLARSITGRDHQPEHVTRFDFAAGLGLTPDEKRAVTDQISHGCGWWRELKPYPGVVEGVAALRDVADVWIVTSPWNSCPTWLHDREHWLKRHFDIPHARVIATSAKHLVSGDVFVDDKTEACERWEDEQGCVYRPKADGPLISTFAVQWETPHNRLDGWTGRSTRSWEQLVEWCR